MEFEVGTEWEYLCFCVYMLGICVCGAACDDSECNVLGCLELMRFVSKMGDQRVFPYSMMGH